MELAAAEAGLETRDFYDRIRWNTRLNNLGLGQLLAPGGAVKRDVWEKHFGDVVRELQLGVHLPGQQLAARWDSTRANVVFFPNATRQRFVQPAAAPPRTNRAICCAPPEVFSSGRTRSICGPSRWKTRYAAGPIFNRSTSPASKTARPPIW